MKRKLAIAAVGLWVAALALSCAGNPAFTGGKNYVQQGVWDKAAESFKLAAAKDPKNAEIQYYLGWAYCENGKYREAGEAFGRSKELSDKFAAKSDEKIDFYWGDIAAKGQEFAEASQFDKATELMEKALYLKPNDLNTYWYVANLYGQMGDVEKAREKYEKALQLDPDNDTTLTNYAKFLGEHKMEADAIPLFEKLLEEREDDENLARHLAELYDRAGEEEKALEIYKRLGDASVLMNDAYVYYDGKEYDQAAKLYEKAKMIAEKGSDDYFDAFYYSAASFYKAGDYEKALEVGEALVAEKGDDPRYWRLLGNCYKNVKRNNDALKAFKKSEELESRK